MTHSQVSLVKEAARLANAFKTFCDERLNLIFIDTSAREQLCEHRMMEGEDNASREYDVYTAIELPVSQQPCLMALSGISRLSQASLLQRQSELLGFRGRTARPDAFRGTMPFSESFQNRRNYSITSH